MAIRVSSNTPQQTQASAETFGYIRSYRSPLEGVQAADTGRGLQQAGQALQNVASVMKRKEDEAGKLAASNAYQSYDARLKATNDGLKNAYDKGNKEEQAQFRAEFDSLNPENKDFVLGTEVDKKYYEPYLGALAKNWELDDIAHNNAKNQYKIRNDLIEHVDNGTNTVAQFRLQKDIGFNQYGEQIDKIIVAGTKSSIDALSSDRAKNAYRGDMSNLARSVYHEQILRAKSPEDLDAIQQDMLTRLTVPGGLSTFFGETDQRAIESIILSRKGQMVANDFAELKAIAANDLNKVINNISQISAEIDSLDNPELPIIISDVRELWESIDSSMLPDNGQRTHNSVGAFLSKFNPNVHYNPDTGQEVNVGTDFSIDIKAMTKNPNYVIPVDEDLRPEEATKYRTMVENTVNRAKTAFQNGGGTDALKVLLGKDYDPSSAKDAAIALGYPTTPLTNLPTVAFPNDPLNDDAARNTYFSQLFENNSATQVMAYGTYVTNQAQTNAERFQGYLITQIAGDVARGVDPNTLVERTSMLAGLTRIGSAGMNIEEQNAYNRFIRLAESQSVEFQMPILAEIERARRDGAVFLTNQEGNGYLDNLLKGMFLNAYREKDQNRVLGLNEKKEVYNKVLQFDAKAVSVMNGYLSNSDHVSSTFGILSNSGAMDVRLPPSMSDEVEYNRLKFAPFALTGLKRTIGTSDQFTYFGEQFGERKMLLDEKARRTAFVGVHWLVHNGDITYQSLLQQKLANGQPNPLIAHFQEVAEEVDLNNLAESDLFEILMESTSIGVDGTERPTLQMIDFAETDSKELGSVIGVWNYDANEYQPLIYTDNRMAVVPHSHLEEYERIMSTAQEQGYELIPFYNLGADASYDILERIRSGQDLFDDEVGDLPGVRKLEVKARRVSLRGGPQITIE